MTIYYLCPDIETPVGGIRVIYRHVDILNRHGIPAYVVHKKNRFRVNWFSNNTPIVYWRDDTYRRLFAKVARRLDADRVIELSISGGPTDSIGPTDILVIPEEYGPDLATAYGRGIKKVVLNQGCYLTFRGYSLQPDRLITPYRHKDVLATLVNSHDGEKYLKHAFPEMPLHRFRISIDPQHFSYPPEKKKKQICFSRIKSQADALQIVNILKFRDALKGFDIVPFINISQSEVAKLLKESLLFLSFGYPEGFGLPPAEAMACGCIVIGFHGGGGREFFRPEFSYPIEQGDIIGFSRTIEEVIKSYGQNPSTLIEKGRMASDFMLSEYSPHREELEVMQAWQSIARLQ